MLRHLMRNYQCTVVSAVLQKPADHTYLTQYNDLGVQYVILKPMFGVSLSLTFVRRMMEANMCRSKIHAFYFSTIFVHLRHKHLYLLGYSPRWAFLLFFFCEFVSLSTRRSEKNSMLYSMFKWLSERASDVCTE